MVRMGLERLGAENIVSLADDRVRLVTNLLTVLVADSRTKLILG